MNKLVCIGFLILLFTHCHAQLPIIFEEQFNDNKNLWPFENTQNYDCEIKDGYYNIIHKTTLGTGTTFVSSVPFDPNLDYEIETKLTLTSGAINYGYGLYTIDKRLSKVDIENHFTISGDGSFKLYSYDINNTEIEHHKWQKHEAINANYNQNNILTIRRKGSTTFFLVNGIEVYTLTNVSFYGTKIGFVIYDTESIKIDYLMVKQDRGIINVIDNKTLLKKENLGPNINSSLEDLVPVISHDARTLYFSVRSNQPVSDNNYNGEVFYSKLNKDGTWAKRENIGYPINNDQTNSVISVTPDNNTLILTGHYLMDGKSNGGGLSISHLESNGWSVPKDLLIEDYYTNSIFSSYCLSADRKALILELERTDSYGSRDLYVSFQKEDNTWTKPKNLGATINTFGTECTPFLAADGKTLYFSTDGKLGYGSNDIFMSRRSDESWEKWTTPVNLGPQVNSKAWDGYYTIPASGNSAYLVSSENSLGLGDIFSITVAESARPEPVVIIHGKVLDKLTKQPLAATIDYHELSTGADAGSARSNPTDGSYKIILPYGKAYGFLAEKTNFLAESDHIDLTTIKEYIEIERDLYLSPIEVGKSIALNNVFFVRSKAELLPSSFSELDRLVKLLTDNPNLKIEISGHTDNVGDPVLNVKLSEDRVSIIKKYLIDKNIPAKRLSGKGYGGSKPIASNATEETRKLNRRVEFSIVGE